MSKNSYSHILKYTGLFGGIQCLNILMALVRNKFVAVILGPQGMGLVSLFNSTVSLVSNSSNFGIQTSAVRNISEAYEKGDRAVVEDTIRTIRTWSAVTAVFGMLLCAAVAPLMNHFTFSWGDHTLHYVCLAPVVGLMAVTGGETAILKGVRQLGRLARISIYNIIGALLTSVPLYYVFRQAAIVPSLIIMAAVQMALTIRVSYSLYPPVISFRRGCLEKGAGMVRLGIAFVVAGIFGSGADFVIRSYLNNVASLDVVGLYNAAYMMTMVYAGMVFTSMETDFFPRLSAVNGNARQLNSIVNRQIEVSLLIVSPLLVALMIGLPVILPMLYSVRFLSSMDMIRIVLLAMYLRAVSLPMAYITLSVGDSRGYMALEAVYDIVVVALTIVCFDCFGLAGAGAAILVANVIDVLVIYAYAYCKFSYRMGGAVLRYLSLQFPIGIAALAVSFLAGNQLVYWVAGILLVAVSGCASLRILQSKTAIWDKLVSRMKRREYGK